MDKDIKIAIIDANENSRLVVRSILQNLAGISALLEAGDFAAGLELVKKAKPEIVILNLTSDDATALKLAAKITHFSADTILFVTATDADPDLIIRAMRAGAREFLKQPLSREDLQNALNVAVRALKQEVREKPERGRVIGVYGAKGGVGGTTLATNLAISAAKYMQKNVILLDLNLQFGSAALFLDMKPKYSMLDVAKNIESLDVDLLKATLPKHGSGLCLLSGPENIEDAENITGKHMEQTLNLLRNIFDFIIIDFPKNFDELALVAMDEADEILLLTVLDVAAVFNTRRCLALFERMGYSRDKVRVVINRYAHYDGMDLAEMEKSINYPIFWRIPNHDYASVVRSINIGNPISNLRPRATLSLNYLDLIRSFNGHVSMAAGEKEVEVKASLFKKLLGQRS